MDKDTKIELLKIFAMVVVLVLLIIGIVWMNKDDKNNVNPEQTSEVVESENEDSETVQNEISTENNASTENEENTANEASEENKTSQENETNVANE